MRSSLVGLLTLILLSGCAPTSSQQPAGTNVDILSGQFNPLYSNEGREYQVEFKALYKTTLTNLSDLEGERNYLERYDIPEATKYLMGPINHRAIGSPQKKESIQILVDEAKLVDGVVQVPFLYKNKWLLHKRIDRTQTLELPMPLTAEGLETENWKQCGDSAPDHQTWGFFWYFWDPTRFGCDHKLGEQYQMIQVGIGAETAQTTASRPEYDRMIHIVNGRPTLAMTFAFGYVDAHTDPKPFTDSDYGMREFQKFHRQVKAAVPTFVETALTPAEYGVQSNIKIGTKFTGVINGVDYVINVVAAAKIDQLEVFAKSFAVDHEGFFGWFGHSYVGSGFDTQRLRQLMAGNPSKYSISPEYQLVYWAGCNSYAYYTLPFFKLKSEIDPNDQFGTKNLDLMSNGLASLFAFNAFNANLMLEALIHPETQPTYQTLVDRLEEHADDWGYDVIVNVLGDEDNP